MINECKHTHRISNHQNESNGRLHKHRYYRTENSNLNQIVISDHYKAESVLQGVNGGYMYKCAGDAIKFFSDR